MSTITETITAAMAEQDAKENPLKINDELRDLLDAQTEQSYAELKKLIEDDGVRDPVVVWKDKNILVTGHTRKKIADELKIPLPKVYKAFKDLDEAKQFAIRDQLARRNLTKERFEYFVGKLYNTEKIADNSARVTRIEETGGINTAEKVGKEYGLSERTVRRLGDKAEAIDKVEELKGKFAKQEQLSGQPTYSNTELKEIKEAPTPTVAKKVIEKIDTKQAIEKAVKEKAKLALPTASMKGPARVDLKAKLPATLKPVAKAPAPAPVKETLYKVALVEPKFDGAAEAKPKLDKDAAVYMIAQDECLVKGIQLLLSWHLDYQGEFILFSSKDMHPGTYTKVNHQVVLIGTKGEMTGPKKGKEHVSCFPLNGEIGPAVIKIIDEYHNGAIKKIDMRRGIKPLAGWEVPSPVK